MRVCGSVVSHVIWGWQGNVNDILLLWPDGVHTICEFLSLRIIGKLRLHPDEVGVGRIRNGAVDGALAATLVPVVALAGACGFPVKVDVYAGETLCDGAGLLVALSLALLEELLDEFLLVDVHAGVDGVDDGFVEELEVGFLCPGIFNGLEFGAVIAG